MLTFSLFFILLFKVLLPFLSYFNICSELILKFIRKILYPALFNTIIPLIGLLKCHVLFD